MAALTSQFLTLVGGASLLPGLFYAFPVPKRLPPAVHLMLLTEPLLLGFFAALMYGIDAGNLVLAGSSFLLMIGLVGRLLFLLIRELTTSPSLLSTSNSSSANPTLPVPGLIIEPRPSSWRTVGLPTIALRTMDGRRPSNAQFQEFHKAQPRQGGVVEWRFLLWSCGCSSFFFLAARAVA